MSADFSITPRRIIGTGSPFDIITMIPIIHSHGVQRACKIAAPDDPECEEPIQRVVIVDHTDPPDVIEAATPLGFCERHFTALS